MMTNDMHTGTLISDLQALVEAALKRELKPRLVGQYTAPEAEDDMERDRR